MSTAATIDDLVHLEERMDSRFDELQTNILSAMNSFANDVNKRFSDHDEEFRKLNQKYDHLLTKTAGV